MVLLNGGLASFTTFQFSALETIIKVDLALIG